MNLLKAIFFALLLASPEARAAGSFLIISDFDDTIKVTGSHYPWASVASTVVGRAPISGMGELGRDWVASSGEMWKIVTGSPTFLRGLVQEFFSTYDIPLGGLFLQSWGNGETTQQFKVRTIAKLIRGTTVPVILIGDDTQWDPGVFAELKAKFGERITASYVHQVHPKHPALPPGITAYVTPAELVLHEMRANRLSDLTLARVLLEISKRPLNQLFPVYYYCPTQYVIDRELLRTASIPTYESILRHEGAVEHYCRSTAAQRAAYRADAEWWYD